MQTRSSKALTKITYQLKIQSLKLKKSYLTASNRTKNILIAKTKKGLNHLEKEQSHLLIVSLN